jgi:hypothetical protein
VTDVTTDQEVAELSAADRQLLRELTERARTGGLKLTGERGLLGTLTKVPVAGARQQTLQRDFATRRDGLSYCHSGHSLFRKFSDLMPQQGRRAGEIQVAGAASGGKLQGPWTQTPDCLLVMTNRISCRIVGRPTRPSRTISRRRGGRDHRGRSASSAARAV